MAILQVCIGESDSNGGFIPSQHRRKTIDVIVHVSEPCPVSEAGVSLPPRVFSASVYQVAKIHAGFSTSLKWKLQRDENGRFTSRRTFQAMEDTGEGVELVYQLPHRPGVVPETLDRLVKHFARLDGGGNNG